MLVKVDKFIFSVDFDVLDMDKGRDVPIILRRSFLCTVRALIDVEKGKLTLKVQDQEVTFNFFKALKFPNDADECFGVSVVNSVTSEVFDENYLNDPLKATLVVSSERNDEEFIKCLNLMDALARVMRT